VQTIGIGAIVDANEAHDETTEMWLRGLDGQRRFVISEHSIGVQERADIKSFEAVGRERHDQFAP
jgi:hypothetical protein